MGDGGKGRGGARGRTVCVLVCFNQNQQRAKSEGVMNLQDLCNVHVVHTVFLSPTLGLVAMVACAVGEGVLWFRGSETYA